MKTIRKSNDGNTIITSRAAGYAISTRKSRWATDVAFRGTMVVEWETVDSGLSLDHAMMLFDRIADRKAA